MLFQIAFYRTIGWYKLHILNICPRCDSLTPMVSNCKVCNAYCLENGDECPPTSKIKRKWWKKFNREIRIFIH